MLKCMHGCIQGGQVEIVEELNFCVHFLHFSFYIVTFLFAAFKCICRPQGHDLRVDVGDVTKGGGEVDPHILHHLIPSLNL